MRVVPLVEPPQPRADAVPRTRLTRRLDRVHEAGVGLISAASGYGKSALLASWVQEQQQSVDVVWLTLEAQHEDPRVLAEHLAIAIEPVCSVGPSTDLSDVLASLVTEASRRQRRVVLVLDDTHKITQPGPVDALTSLVERRPPQLVVVLSGREDPPLPLDALRARGQLVEIRTHDLAFTDAEAQALFSHTFSLVLPEGQVDELREQTEGWSTGLCLAGHALRGADDPAGMLDARPEYLRYIAGYFEQEMINQLSLDIVAFLEHTAVVDELDPALCNHLTGRSDAIAVLEYLVARNLFTERVGFGSPRFRYHDLLIERLRTRLRRRDANTARALLHRASEWYEQREEPHLAIELALRGQDMARATQLIRLACGPTMSRGYFRTVVHWLETLPDDIVWERPELLLVLGRASGLSGDLASAETALLAATRAIEAMDETAPVGLRIGMLQLQGATRLWAGKLAAAREPFEQAMMLFDEHADDPLLQLFDINQESLQIGLALTRLLVGEFDEAIGLSSDVLEPTTLARPTRSTVLALGIRALAWAWSGDEEAARQAVRQSRRVLRAFGGPEYDAIAVHIACVWLGDEPDASRSLTAAATIAERVRYSFLKVPTLLATARLQLVQGAPVRAWRTLQAADEEIAAMPQPGVFAAMADRLRDQLPPRATDDAGTALRGREREVLEAVARGATRREAAAALHLSINTVKTHLRTTYRKLGVQDLDQAVAVAEELGLLDVRAAGDHAAHRSDS